MKVIIYKSEIDGSVRAPSSKSYTIRALMCAAMASGESRIQFALDSDDTEAAINILRQVGVRIDQKGDSLLVNGGMFREAQRDLYCSDSATTLRFMTAIASIIPGKTRLVPGPSLIKRPIEPLIQVLRQIGVNCYLCENESVVVVEGVGLKGGLVNLEGNVSSQYLSALLLVGPFAEKGINIKLSSPLQSKPYILMTIECLKEFGIDIEFSKDFNEFTVIKQLFRPTEYVVEGDWSSASYLLALGAVSGRIEVENLKLESMQGDKILLSFMREMGAVIEERRKSIMVKSSDLRAIKANLEDCIDLLPTMAILAATATGTSEFVGISRARIKESNRVAAIVDGLSRLGLEVVEERDRLKITGNEPHSAIIDSCNDHRIAMAFAILGMKTGGIIINKAECVSKTFPGFWGVIKDLGGQITESGK
jgi:3-phosphoshikimate 1-carboxyvinyltransferase